MKRKRIAVEEAFVTEAIAEEWKKFLAGDDVEPGFRTMGEYLDATKFRPIFEATQALDMPLYLHPREPAPIWVAPYLDYGLFFAGLGFSRRIRACMRCE